MKKSLLKPAGYLLAALFLLVLFRRVPVEEITSLWREARLLYILPALILSVFSNCFLAAFKWGVILKSLGLNLPFRENWLMKTAGGTIRSVMPLRTGEAGRLVYLRRRHGFPWRLSAAAVLAELVPNVLVLAVLTGAGALVLGLPAGLAIIPLAAAGVLTASLAALRSRAFRERIAAILPRAFKARWLRAAGELPGHFRGGSIAAILGLSVLIQAAKLPSFWLLGAALGVSFPVNLYLVFLPAAILISSVPLTFLGLGLREYSLQELSLRFSALPMAPVTGTALLFTLVEYLFPALLGVFWTKRFVSETLEGNACEVDKRTS